MVYAVYTVSISTTEELYGIFSTMEKALESIEPLVRGESWKKLGDYFWFRDNWETVYIKPMTVY